MKVWAQEALSEGSVQEVIVNRGGKTIRSFRITGTASNGLRFEGYLDIDTKKIISYYPVIK